MPHYPVSKYADTVMVFASNKEEVDLLDATEITDHWFTNHVMSLVIPLTLENAYALYDYVGYNVLDHTTLHADNMIFRREKARFLLGTWDCADSPYKVCVYDTWQDPACDLCVLCGKPDERK